MQINSDIPQVSVIIPCYKVETYLRTCIESVIHQTYQNWELVLVDDGSPDNSGHICDYYASNDSRIRVIHKSNGGLSSARNSGLDIIRGEYVTFLDSDDFWHIDYLKTLMELIITHGADIAQCDFLIGTEDKFPTIRTLPNIVIYDNRSVFIKQAAKIIMWGKIYKTVLFRGVRMPEGLTHEDDWTTWKLYYRAKKIVAVNLPLYYYTHNPMSIMGNVQKTPDFSYLDAYKERIKYFQDHGEMDLADSSRLYLCKSLLLSYSNKSLPEQQKSQLKQMFDENWSQIRHAKVIPQKLKLLFNIFYVIPFISNMINWYRYLLGRNRTRFD